MLDGPSDAAAVSAAVEAILRDANIDKVRKNGVWVVEVLVSLSPAFAGNSPAFFRDALKWIREFLGGVIFSAVVHRDEASEHMHVLVVPILEGRLRGNAYIGNRYRLQAIQIDFYAKVASSYELVRPPPKTRLIVAQKNDTAAAVVLEIQANPSHLENPRVQALLREAIAKDPVEIARAINIPVSPVHATPKMARKPVDQNTIAGKKFQIDPEKTLVFSGEVIHTNHYPVYSGLTYPQSQSPSLH